MTNDKMLNQISFEFPYNFDKNLLKGLQLLSSNEKNINCIYVPPFHEDYTTIIRTNLEKEVPLQLTKKEYYNHIDYINEQFPNKLQLLLQHKKDILMNKEILKKYINMGFNNFCVGSIEQAQLIKEIDANITIIGSIAMHINGTELLLNNQIYNKYFDGFVLDFSFTKAFSVIKLLPNNFKYILLINSLCNNHCDGDHHWWSDGKNYQCSGLIDKVGFSNSCLIRPMDLQFFTPYIKIFKLQDRCWPTNEILRDFVLYTTDYSLYPNIIYTQEIYNSDSL